MMTSALKRVSLLGAGLSLCDERELLAFIQEAIAAQRKVTVLSGNIYSFNLAYEHPWLRQFFNQADIVRLDGAGVRLGARLLGHDTPARMTWADFGWSLAGFAAQHGHSLFLLGSRPGVAETAAARLQTHSPNLQVVGIHHGYFDKTTGSEENEAVLAQINAARPAILIVGFGMPLQERWLMENGARIDANVILTGGAVFDYISGELRRGPTWLTDHGMEWLARLLIEPRRLWKRYLVGNPLFLYRVLRQKLGMLHLDG
mgnify:CR=1 FL=1